MNRLQKLLCWIARPVLLGTNWWVKNLLHNHSVESWNVGRRAKVGQKVSHPKGSRDGI